MTITLHDNFYNVRSETDIPEGKLVTINSLIGEIGMSHYGLKWIYVVDSMPLRKPKEPHYDIILNGDRHKLLASFITLNEVVEHLWTILRTLELFKKDLKINDSYIMDTMKKDTVENLYKKIVGNNDKYSINIEKSIVGTIKGEYKI